MEKQTENSEENEKLKIRCPACAKLYEVEAADIQSSTPQFQCLSCHSRFSFAYPPVNPNHILCTPVDAEGHVMVEDVMKAQKACPKCAALSPRDAEECYSCHVIFAKVEGLPQDPHLRAQPSLVRKWKMLADDFENETKHEEFIQACSELEALNFAMSKYQDMKQALGGDATCDRMMKRLHGLLETGLRIQAGRQAAAPTGVIKKINWKSSWSYGLYAFSLLMILWGSLSLGHRNLVGLGVATACLTTGILLSRGSGRLWH